MELGDDLWISEGWRILVAIFIGAAIGLNRDLVGKAAGVRTHALVSLGSALATIVGTAGGSPEAASRVVQGIVTGIGFIGSGVIVHRARAENAAERAYGLTTAAGIWVAALLGAACGVARYDVVVIGGGGTLIVLMLGGPLERLVRQLRGEKEDDTNS